MYDLTKIDLGKDEAEQDQRLADYFLKTQMYKNALTGTKTIIIGRKGSGKSAIFTLLKDELASPNAIVIPITPDQYSWGALKDYQDIGILPIQANTNAWKLTLLASIIWKLNEIERIPNNSKLKKYYQYLKDSYVPGKDNWFYNLIEKTKNFLRGIKTEWISFDWGQPGTVATPLRINEEIKSLLLEEWPSGVKARILIDRLDDSWDGSEDAKHIIIGLLKAANEINSTFKGNIIVTIFIRSDIYDNLYFDDQDKLRQYEEVLSWDSDELKSVICERVRVSLGLEERNCPAIWSTLFSPSLYRSKSAADKYIIDRTFKRPRDIISFVRFCIENAIRNRHISIEPSDTQNAEERNYSQSKYKDLIIEYQNQYPFIKDLLDSFSGTLHKKTKDELISHLASFIEQKKLSITPTQLIRSLFMMGVIGIKRQGRYGIGQRGGAHFFYYYDDPSIDPLRDLHYYIHPSLRYYLHITERRER
jgi:hypothetical protein